MKSLGVFFLTLFMSFPLLAQNEVRSKIDALADKIEPKVIEWRRHFHQNPELSNREFKTAEKVAAHLKKLGMQVQTKVAHTGVVGILKGSKSGPVVALRADMDGLPRRARRSCPSRSGTGPRQAASGLAGGTGTPTARSAAGSTGASR